MEHKHRDILLQDLCARLPYGVKVQDRNGTHELTVGNTELADLIHDGRWLNIKPYLRPLSSMTEEEKKEYKDLLYCVKYADDTVLAVNMLTDWLNAHHFDYRGLIPMGLAVEAPEGMYNVVS